MKLALFAFGLFSAGFLLHWVWWRIRIPTRQSATILLLLLGTLFVGLAVAPYLSALEGYRPRNFWEVLHVATFHIAMTLAYIVAYSALEARSPSMTLLTHVADSGEAGRSEEELFAVLGGMTPIEARLVAMSRDKMILLESGSCVVTPKGRVWAQAFGSWRRLILLNKGG